MADKIIITVPRKPKSGNKKRKLRRGPIINKKKSDYLSRRRVGSAINFYDLGQISDGAGGWLDLTFPPLIPYDTPPKILDALTVANWDVLKDAIFAVPSGQWSTKFRKLTYEDAERYGLDLYDVDADKSYPVGRNDSRIDLFTFAPIADTTWTNLGLEMPADANWQALSFGSFLSLAKDPAVLGAAPFKVTTDPSYAADAVSFDMKLTPGTDVFLVPNILEHNGIGSDGGVNYEYFQAGYRTLQRSFWLPRNDPATNYPLLSLSDVTGSNTTDLVSQLKPDADLWLSSDAEASYIQQPDASSYPNQPGVLSIDASATAAGIFIGAIRRGGTLYYIWATDSWSITADRSITI